MSGPASPLFPARTTLMGTQDSGETALVPVDDHGHLEVAIHSPLTAFGELRTAELSPRIQERFSYGIPLDTWRTFVAAGGGVAATQGAAEVSIATGTSDSAVLQTRRRLAYRPGQGALLRFTAAFPGTGVTNLRRLAGIGSVESGWFVGEDPTDGTFGFLHRYGGLREIRTLTVTVGAGGAENVTITLNGATKVVALTSGTATFNASQIAAADFSTTGVGWDVDQVGATVIFIARTAEPLAGTFSLANGGGGATSAGTFARTRAGVVPTDDWTPQTEWSNDRLDGSNGNYNPSGVDLDKTKGNVYALQWQYLGYDPQALYVEVVPPGDNNVIFILAHQNNYLNENNYPSVVNPAAPVYIEARSLGAAASRMVRTGSVAGFIEGHVAPAKGMPIASNLSAALGTTEIPLFTLRMPHTTDSVANQVIAELHKLNLSFKPQTANYYATLRVRRNATLTGGTNYARHYPYGAMLIDKTATGISGGTIEFEVTLTDTGTLPYDFDEQNLLLDPGDTLSFTAVANNGTTNIVSMSATFGEIR